MLCQAAAAPASNPSPTTAHRIEHQPCGAFCFELLACLGQPYGYPRHGAQAPATLLYAGSPPPGQMQVVQIDGKGLPSGLYVIRVAGSSFVKTQTVTRLK